MYVPATITGFKRMTLRQVMKFLYWAINMQAIFILYHWLLFQATASDTWVRGYTSIDTTDM